jgi:hypothetical protein
MNILKIRRILILFNILCGFLFLIYYIFADIYVLINHFYNKSTQQIDFTNTEGLGVIVFIILASIIPISVISLILGINFFSRKEESKLAKNVKLSKKFLTFPMGVALLSIALPVQYLLQSFLLGVLTDNIWLLLALNAIYSISVLLYGLMVFVGIFDLNALSKLKLTKK